MVGEYVNAYKEAKSMDLEEAKVALSKKCNKCENKDICPILIGGKESDNFDVEEAMKSPPHENEYCSNNDMKSMMFR